ncbi:MOSC domain-containing protein [Pseudonocardia humida]|uniref:MOSC domain-containing protein n=1 Tax=Pseudonocardia humida TaxID=2800819 RepID=A0ABT1A6N6_9PSEU|nr:MOSC N-terminal beta barrel domain-containing protein [Pseudonocardia humida]MCO1658631.1 MOSC domain-containing protein [Pseudonocardia humida]
MTATATVRSLHRYPVKSMLGETLEQAVLGPAGVIGDRGYAVIDAEDGTVASAKHPRKWARLLDLRAAYVEEPREGEPLPPVAITFPDGGTRRSDDPAVDEAVSAIVGRPVRLTATAPEKPVFEEQWPEIEGLAPAEFITGTTSSHTDGEPVSTLQLAALAPKGSFVDLAVLHVLTTATLRALAAAAPGSSFDPRRYRPNVLLDVPDAAFAEDEWVGGAIDVGGAGIAVRMSTMRCVMTTLAQGELPEDRDTLRTIARLNRRTIEGMGRWACAGVYADIDRPGTVRRGDTAEVRTAQG